MAELIDRLFYIGAAAYPMVDCEYLCSLFVQPIATGVQMQYLSSLPAGLPGSGSAAFQTDDSCSVSVVESMGELVRQADQQQWSKKCVRCGQDNGMYLKRLDALEAIITAGALHQFVCCRWCVCTQCVQLPILCPFSAHRRNDKSGGHQAVRRACQDNQRLH